MLADISKTWMFFLEKIVKIAKSRSTRESGQGWFWVAMVAMAKVNPWFSAREKKHGIFCCVPGVGQVSFADYTHLRVAAFPIHTHQIIRDCMGLCGASVAWYRINDLF